MGYVYGACTDLASTIFDVREIFLCLFNQLYNNNNISLLHFYKVIISEVLAALIRYPQGSHVSWKVVEFKNGIFEAWKVMGK